MSKLFKILDGIISSDYAEQTLESVDEVINYAESAGEVISVAQAERIIGAGKNWLSDIENGNGEWGRMRGEAKEALAE